MFKFTPISYTTKVRKNTFTNFHDFFTNLYQLLPPSTSFCYLLPIVTNFYTTVKSELENYFRIDSKVVVMDRWLFYKTSL